MLQPCPVITHPFIPAMEWLHPDMPGSPEPVMWQPSQTLKPHLWRWEARALTHLCCYIFKAIFFLILKRRKSSYILWKNQTKLKQNTSRIEVDGADRNSNKKRSWIGYTLVYFGVGLFSILLFWGAWSWMLGHFYPTPSVRTQEIFTPKSQIEALAEGTCHMWHLAG